MYVYLIRHGQSEGNKLSKIQGWQDFPLSIEGERQAKFLGEFFKNRKLHAIYSSDLTRAYRTAEEISKNTNVPVQKLELFREINLGPLEGKTRAEIYEQFPEVKERSILTSGVPGTETIEEISHRCQRIIAKMYEYDEDDHIAIITHGGLISILLMYIISDREWYRLHRPFQIDNTSISLIELKKEQKPLIYYINQTYHLASTR